MTMICTVCGGRVFWVGAWGSLSHTECESCGGRDTHIPEVPVESEGGEAD